MALGSEKPQGGGGGGGHCPCKNLLNLLISTDNSEISFIRSTNKINFFKQGREVNFISLPPSIFGEY